MNKKILAVLVLAVVAAVAYGAWLFFDQSESDTYTMSEVAEHDTAEDCWLVIDGTVYDATDYLDEHPPGSDSIERSCGLDVTAGFEAVRAHSAEAEALLSGYRIGELAE
ncbi:MAG: cytochrome b5 domain-containing protein [Candidatus Saccharimonadales bacterium]